MVQEFCRIVKTKFTCRLINSRVIALHYYWSVDLANQNIYNQELGGNLVRRYELFPYRGCVFIHQKRNLIKSKSRSKTPVHP